MPEVWRSKYDFSLDVVFMVNLHWDEAETHRPTHAGRCVTPRWVDKAKASATRGWWPLAEGCGASWLGHAVGTAPQPRRPMVAWHVADDVSRHGASMAGPRARGSNQSAPGRFPLSAPPGACHRHLAPRRCSGYRRADGRDGSRRRHRARRSPPAGGAQAGATFVGHGVGEQAYVAQRPCRLPGRAVELAAGAGCAVGAQPRDFQRPGAARPGGRQWPRRGSGRCRSA